MPEETSKGPEGKFVATVRVGEKGQIVIPKAAREMFQIKPGDTLLLLADINQGIAIVRAEGLIHFAQSILRAQQEPEGSEE